MGDMADSYNEQAVDAIASGSACAECGFALYDAPGCQCKKTKIRLHFGEYAFPQSRPVLRWRYLSGGGWKDWTKVPKRILRAWMFSKIVYGTYLDSNGNEVADVEL